MRHHQVTSDVCCGSHFVLCWVLPGFNQVAVTMDAVVSWCNETLRNYVKQESFSTLSVYHTEQSYTSHEYCHGYFVVAV